ncbi:hypothetical protein UQ64_14190 [Paenibacillus etheri]|uniref:Uncharacterized protein n=1 Tax=Paenibacillus etheri TaxID=1306852 RepID=A0A0W1AZB4_9BACL|nr:hypothetical protein UQ64_14190 [Paenibacillus etheri]
MKIQIGQRIEIVYKDRSGKITQRIIDVNGIRNGRISLYTTYSQNPYFVHMSMGWEKPCLVLILSRCCRWTKT